MASKSKVKKYDPRKFYMIGERIYHDGFDDTGDIVGVGMTNDGVQKIVVEFEKHGKKRLVMDYKKD